MLRLRGRRPTGWGVAGAAFCREGVSRGNVTEPTGRAGLLQGSIGKVLDVPRDNCEGQLPVGRGWNKNGFLLRTREGVEAAALGKLSQTNSH